MLTSLEHVLEVMNPGAGSVGKDADQVEPQGVEVRFSGVRNVCTTLLMADESAMNFEGVGGGFNWSVQHGRFSVLSGPRRCAGGESGSSRRVVRGRQAAVVGQVEGWRIHQRHRSSTTEACRLHSRDARSYWRDLSASAAQAKMCAHPRRAGGDLPRARRWRLSSCDRRPAEPARLHRV
jgi:hypothetical protein